MLEFKTPEIDDKAWVDECFKYLKTMNCDYTFGNIFVWSTEYSTKISRFKDFFICSWGRGKETNFGVPIGTGNFKEAVGAVIEYAKANDMRISDIFVDIFDNKAVIKYSDKDLLQKYSNNLNGNKLYDALEAEGIENIMLPFDLYYTPYKIIEKEVDENTKTVVIKFENNSQLKLKEFEQETNIKNLEIEGTFIASKQIRIQDTDIYLFESQNNNAKQTFISYQIEMTQYLIVIDDDITAAEEFVTKNRI